MSNLITIDLDKLPAPTRQIIATACGLSKSPTSAVIGLLNKVTHDTLTEVVHGFSSDFDNPPHRLN